MQVDYIHISIILDRTGSMERIRDDTIGGFNAFLEEQQQLPGHATLTLVQFDTQDPYEVIHHFKPIQDIPKLSRETYVPRASTPLLDAIGRGINDLEHSIAKLDAHERPGKVVLVIITDGKENSSQEFKKDQIVKMIKQHQRQHNWQFVFLSADLNAIDDAQAYGFHRGSSLRYARSAHGVSSAWSSFSDTVTGHRQSKDEQIQFTDADRQQQEEESKK
ncbi:MAG: vWA domain-containing protein [Pseudomonadota bacterium]|nr:vWA domain-containing protein [Pseudomonadota bacterium]